MSHSWSALWDNSHILPCCLYFSCYGCLSSTVSHCITLLHALSTQSFSKFGEERLIRELVASNLNSGPLNLRRDSMLLLCTLTKGNLQATTLLHEMLYERITEAMDFCTTATSLVSSQGLTWHVILNDTHIQYVQIRFLLYCVFSGLTCNEASLPVFGIKYISKQYP